MKTRQQNNTVRPLVLALRCALLSSVALPFHAFADETDSELYGLTHPANKIEFGALYTSQRSAKFGEYNGLNQEGFYGIGSFSLAGGDSYDNKNSALRWWLDGRNIGTTSRSFNGKVADQGKWSFSFGYDELQHNITDSFQTPFQGSVGGNVFNLPNDFGTVNSSSRNLSANQLNKFHTEKESSIRRNAPFSATYQFSESLSAQVDYNHLEQSGAKLIGTGSQGGVSLTGSSTGRGEAINFLLNPTSYTTDNINGMLHWTGDKAYLSAGYYGSLFHDDFNSVSWQNPIATAASTCSGSGCYVNNNISTAPSNSLHQANLNGGYNFSSATKLVGGFSYGYNSQNDSFAPTRIVEPRTTINLMQAGAALGSGLNGVVETTHGDLKLTDQSIKDLTLSAAFKFNERNNLTDSSLYKYYQIGSLTTGYNGVNTPYSNRKGQYELAAAYNLSKNQNIRLAYENEDIQRWCNNVYGGAQCVVSPDSNENKMNLNYRLKALSSVNFTAGYSYANRSANFDHNYVSNAGTYSSAAISGSGLNGGDYLGYIAYPYANRIQNQGKAGVVWQATEKLDLGLNGRYTYDDYDATLGVQNGQSAGLNLDATYTLQENTSISGYWSWQNGYRNLRSANSGNGASQIVAPTNIWTNQLEDNSNAFGVLTRQAGLLNGKLEILTDLSYAIDTSGYSTQVPYDATCAAANKLTCGSLPDIKNEIMSFKLTGNYKLHKNGKLSMAYIYQKLNSNDYFYSTQQFGLTPARVIPNNLQPQDYTVNVVALSYIYSF